MNRLRNCSFRMATSLALTFAFVAIACGCQGGKSPESSGTSDATRLVYQFTVPEGRRVNNELVEQAIARRLAPLTTSAQVQVLKDNRVEILLEAKRAADVARAKRLLAARGGFELRIIVDRERHADIVEQATAGMPTGKPIVYGVLEEDRLAGEPRERPLAKWVKVRRSPTRNGQAPLVVNVRSDVIRDGKTKKLIKDIPEDLAFTDEAFDQWLNKQGIQDVEVLILLADGYDITSDSVAESRSGTDHVDLPCVIFQMTAEGAIGLRGLTEEYQPEGDRDYRLGIIVNETLMTAPTLRGVISERGQITGKFSEQEVEAMTSVMRTNSLPIQLGDEPIIEESVNDPVSK